MQIETFAVALVTLVVIAAPLPAQERKLKRSELPPAVQRVAEEQSKGAM